MFFINPEHSKNVLMSTFNESEQYFTELSKTFLVKMTLFFLNSEYTVMRTVMAAHIIW